MLPRDRVPGTARDCKQQRCCEHDTCNVECQGDIPRREGEISAFATQEIRYCLCASNALGTCNSVLDMAARKEKHRSYIV
jgi:hypothetical protein